MSSVRLKPFIILLIIQATACFPALSQDSFRGIILKKVNESRKTGCRCGDEYMPPAEQVYWSQQLEKSASRHVNDMYRNNHFDHLGTDGSELDDRVNATGYKWSLIGENIAWGYSDPIEVVTGWLSSPGHCRAMMNPLFREIGVARRGSYWAMDLGRGLK